MVDENVQVDRRLLPRSTAEQSNRAALSWGLALFEGAVASMMMLLPALAYHIIVMQVPLSNVPFELYGFYSTLVGLLYGGFAAASAGRFLDKARHRHAMLAESGLGWTASFAIALLVAFLLGLAGDLSRVSLTSAYVFGLPVLLAVRNVAYAGVDARIRSGQLQYQKVTVIGLRADVSRFLANGNLWRNGYQLAGRLHLEDVPGAGGPGGEAAIVGFAQTWIGRGAEYIVFVGDLGDIEGLERIVTWLKRFAVSVVCAPATASTGFKFLDVVRIGPNNALRFLRKPMGDVAVLVKRVFDLAAAGFGLLLLAPLFAGVALFIKLDSAGPVFYRQERRGFNGQTFFIWKFRSMRVTEDGRQMSAQARRDDPRITRVGRFIRKTSIDELPQLFNVLAGNMSLVGPRPHAVSHDAELSRQLEVYAHRQRIKPGITGWAQVNGYRGDTSTYEQIEGRTRHDLYYIDNWSIFLDVWIVLLTLFSGRTRANAV